MPQIHEPSRKLDDPGFAWSMVKTTRAQRHALKRLHDRMEADYVEQIKHGVMPTVLLSYRQFRKSAQPYFDDSGCIMVQWANMWVGIERDGYTHS